ncbi:hypothetical protein B0H13DRAFT_2376899 [Mycena leptocephala]|nr:hypothetical protein B0H13DRAFT_2376899 [Mycena leptocephala]
MLYTQVVPEVFLIIFLVTLVLTRLLFVFVFLAPHPPTPHPLSRARALLFKTVPSASDGLRRVLPVRDAALSSTMTRSSSRKISASIAKLAAQDFLDSDDEINMDLDADEDVTVVQSEH